jgi:hypothetical protein
MKRHIITAALLLMASGCFAQAAKPNILVIFGDDVGVMNISAYVDIFYPSMMCLTSDKFYRI